MRSNVAADGTVTIIMTQAEAIQLRDEAYDNGLDVESAIGSRFIDELDSCIEEDEEDEEDDNDFEDEDDDEDFESSGDLVDEN